MAEYGSSEAERDVELVLSCVEHSARHKQDYDEIDREVMENYLVQPFRQLYNDGPYHPRFDNHGTLMKDTETYVSIETLLAKLTLSMIGDAGYVQTVPIGREDSFGSEVSSAVIERVFRLPGNPRAMHVGIKDALLFGASAMFPTWRYEEGERKFRSVVLDPFSGSEEVQEQTLPVAIRDDVEFVPIDRDDLFDDPGADTIDKMSYCARRFRIAAWEARELGKELLPDGEPRWDPEAVERAIERGAPKGDEASTWRDGLDRPTSQHPHPDYQTLIGYEWWGQTPYLPKDKARRRRITVLNQELMECRRNPLHISRTIPFFEFVVNPIRGRFRGIAPGAVARFTQSFYDALLICLVEAVVRQTNPPFIVARYQGVDIDKLRAWKPKVPITALTTEAIKEIPYNPPLQAAFQMLQVMKANIQGGTGALEPIQGLGFGTKRMSGTESAFLAQQVMDRPEMIASLFEWEYLPALGKGIFELCQQFIRDTEDLALRVGNSRLRQAPRLEQILADYDIEFVGSRRMQSKQAQLQFIERAWATIGAIPGAAPIFPWSESIVEWLHAAGLRKLETLVGQATGVEDFIANAVMQASKGMSANNGNGEARRLPPAGLAPAQIAGGILG